MVRDEFTHSREVKTSLDNAEGPMYSPVTCDDGVVVCCDDFLNTVFRDNDFVVGPQSTVLEVLAFVVLELPGCWVEEVGENLGVLTVVVHPVVENGVGGGDEATDDVGDWEDGSKDFF